MPKIEITNDILQNKSITQDFTYLNNRNIDCDDLNGSKLHQNKQGTSKLASKFIKCIKSDMVI